MRLSILAFLAACATSTTSPSDAPGSLRERLAGATRVTLASAESAGAITAERHVHTGWEAGLVDLVIDAGTVVMQADETLTISTLDVGFAPIAVPAEVFGGNIAHITQLRVTLAAPVTMPATWIAEDEVHAEAVLPLAMTWSLMIDATSVPLGSPMLPPVPVEIVVTGSGERVHAELRAHATGQLWSWLDLVRLADLTLILGGATP